MRDVVYDIEIKTLLGKKIKARKITPVDFLTFGISNIDLFIREKKAIGKFAALQEALDSEKGKNDFELSGEQLLFIENVLTVAVENYEKIKDELIKVEKTLIFNQVFIASCKHIHERIKADDDIVLTCYFLSKNFGNPPSYYLNLPIDDFLFCRHTLLVGMESEASEMKRQQARYEKPNANKKLRIR